MNINVIRWIEFLVLILVIFFILFFTNFDDTPFSLAMKLIVVLVIYAIVSHYTMKVHDEKETGMARHLAEEGATTYIDGVETKIPFDAINSKYFYIEISEDKTKIYLYLK